MVESALSRAIQVWNWPAVRPHDFKRGTLFFLTTDADTRSTAILLSVGDHSPDYVAKYQLPPLLHVTKILGVSRIKAITSALTAYIPPAAWPAIHASLADLAPVFTSKKKKESKRKDSRRRRRYSYFILIFSMPFSVFSIRYLGAYLGFCSVMAHNLNWKTPASPPIRLGSLLMRRVLRMTPFFGD